MKYIVVLAWALVGSTLAAAGPDDRYKPLKGEYSIYSGELDNQGAPTAKDRKVSFIVTGAVARDMFNSMGPDDKDACVESGTRSRSKQNLWCTFGRKDGYTCYFGFDLRSGKSIAGGIC